MYENTGQWKVVLIAIVWIASCTGQSSSQPFRYSIAEQKPAKTFVADLRNDANFIAKYQPQRLQQLRFDQHRASSSSDAKFSIDNQTGVIRTTVELDREQLCPDARFIENGRCQLVFDVAVRAEQFFQIIKVNIEVLDINDNSPNFAEQEKNIAIAETTAPGTLFMLPAADDADSGQFGVREYQLAQAGKEAYDNLPFDLEVTNQSYGIMDVQLRLVGRLDRESKANYQLTVIARDGGSPAKSSELSLTVSVLDANDNHPVFDQAVYSVDVREDTAPGTSLIQVRATDMDEGPNAAVVYSLPDHIERSYGHLFRVDEQTGTVYLRAPVDYERGRVYHLSVAATDNGTPPSLPVFTKLTITVVDINDNKPSIAVNILTDSGAAEVHENVDQPGTFVAHVAARDADSGDNGRVDCMLDDGSGGKNAFYRLEPLFDVETLAAGASVEYKIATATTFDREQRADYQLIVTCQDHGLPNSLMTSREIQVSVLDENDNTPQLDSNNYWITVHENNHVGNEIFRINASDADIGPNAELTFTIRPLSTSDQKSHEVLTVDRTSGSVSTRVSFDFESEPRDFFYIITVSDRGEISRSTTATFRVSVADVNDHKPHFERSSYYMTIAENQSAGSSVGRVNASDGDRSSEFNRIFYNIVRSSSFSGSSSVDADSFIIDTYTGIIRTALKLDREHQSVYVFTVAASNNIGPVTSRNPSDVTDFVDITVYVDDVNDNRPVFLFPGPYRGQTADLPSKYVVGSLITRLEATDLDAGHNAELQYAIASGYEDNTFEIDSSTGVITVGQGLSADRLSNIQQFRLAVIVTDKGNPPLQTVADLFIKVNETGLPVEPGRLSPEQTTDDTGISSAVIAAVGVAVGGALVLVCVVVVAIAVCLTKRRSKRIQRRREKQQQSRDVLDASSSIGGASSCCQHRCRSASSVKPSSSSGYVREPGPGDDSSLTMYPFHSQPGQLGSVRSSLSSISATHTDNQRRSQCHCSRDQTDDVIEHSSMVGDVNRMPLMKTSKCHLDHHLTNDSGFALESPDADRISGSGTERTYSPVSQPATNGNELRQNGRQHHRHHSRHRHHHHHHHHQQQQQQQQQQQALLPCISCSNCSHVHKKRNTDAGHQTNSGSRTEETAISRTASGVTMALLPRCRPQCDAESMCSCSCSCADSGRGPSEDDDLCQQCRLCNEPCLPLGRTAVIAAMSCCEELESPSAV